MRWIIHGERALYESSWMSLHLADVELPDGHRFEHHVLRMAAPAAGTIVHDPGRGILLLYRHRFITDTWGWEIPGGRIEAGEAPDEAAAREVLEETGWQPGPLRHLTEWYPAGGSTDIHFHAFVADGATEVGAAVDAHEAAEIRWLPVSEVRALLRDGGIRDGLSVTALAYAFTFGEL